MGEEKNQMDEDLGRSHEGWAIVAEMKNYRCKIDGEIIDYNDREVFFRTGMCGAHTARMKKSD